LELRPAGDLDGTASIAITFPYRNFQIPDNDTSARVCKFEGEVVVITELG